MLPQGEGVLARASLIAVKVQCRPDFPLENLSMVVGPARQPRSPLAFQVGAEPHFPCLEQFPTHIYQIHILTHIKAFFKLLPLSFHPVSHQTFIWWSLSTHSYVLTLAHNNPITAMLFMVISNSEMYYSNCVYISIFHPPYVWGTIPSMGNVAQPPLGKASGERGWRAGPTTMDRFSSGKSGLHCT